MTALKIIGFGSALTAAILLPWSLWGRRRKSLFMILAEGFFVLGSSLFTAVAFLEKEYRWAALSLLWLLMGTSVICSNHSSYFHCSSKEDDK